MDFLMDRALSDATKEYMEQGNLNYRILTDVIKQAVYEYKDENQINEIFWKKLHDGNLVVGLMTKCDVKG